MKKVKKYIELKKKKKASSHPVSSSHSSPLRKPVSDFPCALLSGHLSTQEHAFSPCFHP